MEEIQIVFSDQARLSFPSATTAVQALAAWQKSALKGSVAARLNGDLIDLTRPLFSGGELIPVVENSPEGLDILRHSTSHLMAQAVKELFPEAKPAIGPAIEQGFYYDFETKAPFVPEDLARIEDRMQALSKSKTPIVREEMSRGEAISFFQSRGEPYKVELLQALEEAPVSLYRQGDFVDLCRGPHLSSSGEIRFFKLTQVAGAYWRGDERNPMLQRIYGTAFFSKKELDEHLHRLEEAKRRDHRRLGRELDLFSI
ncbi:MAG: threonine--tRNA ligase, partial [Desulfobacteraceae bacterium]